MKFDIEAGRARVRQVKADPNSLSNKLERMADRFYRLGDTFGRAGDSLNKTSNSLFRRVTIPIILFILGAVTFPLGILLWIWALILMTGKK